MKPACYKGYLCFGPNQGQHTQFAYPGPQVKSPATPVWLLPRKYLAAYGPATAQDFSRWLYGGTGSRVTREMLASLGDEIVGVDIEGAPAWMLRNTCDPHYKTNPSEAFGCSRRSISTFSPRACAAPGAAGRLPCARLPESGLVLSGAPGGWPDGWRLALRSEGQASGGYD